MTEEELEAIEIIKSIININKENERTTAMLYVSDVDILLNLIEKLQKENEEYKLLNANIEKANRIIEGKEEYIPKDKIRERIEELNNDIKRNVTNMGKAEKANERNLAKAIHHYISSLNIVKEELKKLLEEE